MCVTNKNTLILILRIIINLVWVGLVASFYFPKSLEPDAVLLETTY